MKHFWQILEAILERFCLCFAIFSGMAKTRKIARRLHESIKIECSGGRKWHQNLKKWLRKPVQKRMRKMMPKFTEFCGKTEPKRSQKGIQKSMFFWLVFWKPLETSGGASGERRGSVEGASTERRGSHFLQRIPQGGAILSKNTVE